MNVIILQAIFPLEKTCSAYFQKQNWGVNPQKKTSLEVFCKTINTEDSIICSFSTLLLILSTWVLSWLKHIYVLKLISWCSHQNWSIYKKKNVKFGGQSWFVKHTFLCKIFLHSWSLQSWIWNNVFLLYHFSNFGALWILENLGIWCRLFSMKFIYCFTLWWSKKSLNIKTRFFFKRHSKYTNCLLNSWQSLSILKIKSNDVWSYSQNNQN